MHAFKVREIYLFRCVCVFPLWLCMNSQMCWWWTHIQRERERNRYRDPPTTVTFEKRASDKSRFGQGKKLAVHCTSESDIESDSQHSWHMVCLINIWVLCYVASLEIIPLLLSYGSIHMFWIIILCCFLKIVCCSIVVWFDSYVAVVVWFDSYVVVE